MWCGVTLPRLDHSSCEIANSIRIETANLKHVHSIFFLQWSKACDEFSVAILRRTKICNFNTFFSKLRQSQQSEPI